MGPVVLTKIQTAFVFHMYPQVYYCTNCGALQDHNYSQDPNVFAGPSSGPFAAKMHTEVDADGDHTQEEENAVGDSGNKRQLRYSQRKSSTLKNRLAMATLYRNETCLEESLSSFYPVLSKFILSSLSNVTDFIYVQFPFSNLNSDVTFFLLYLYRTQMFNLRKSVVHFKLIDSFNKRLRGSELRSCNVEGSMRLMAQQRYEKYAKYRKKWLS